MASAAVEAPPIPPHTRALPALRSNQGNQVAATSTDWMRSVTTDVSREEMRSRFDRDGYLWVKHVLPREDVLDIREDYFRHLAPTSILDPATSPRAGIFNPTNDPLAYQGIGALPEEETLKLLDHIHTTPTYRAFLAHPSLRAFVREFTGWKKEILVDRAMLRHNCPGSRSTGIHYDRYFLRAGSAEFLTAWVPIGDCKADGGGLMYLEGSDGLGQEMEREFDKKAKADGLSGEERIDAFNVNMMKDGFLSHDAEEFARVQGKGRRWLVGDYEAGDVVFHKQCMVHAATRNEDGEGRIRLASDLRFYEEGAGLDRRWMKVWRHDDGL